MNQSCSRNVSFSVILKKLMSSSFKAETACYCRSGLYTLEQGTGCKRLWLMTLFPSGWGSWELLVWRMRKLLIEEGQKALLYFWLLSWLITLQVSSLSMAYQYQLLALLTKESNFKIPDTLACHLFKACISWAPLKLWLLPLLWQCGRGRVRKRCPAWERVLRALAVSDLHERWRQKCSAVLI